MLAAVTTWLEVLGAVKQPADILKEKYAEREIQSLLPHDRNEETLKLMKNPFLHCRTMQPVKATRTHMFWQGKLPNKQWSGASKWPEVV